MGWRIKQFFRKIMPFLLIGGVAFGGYHVWKSSRHGRPSFVQLLHKIPYFGSRFRHYSPGGQAYRSGGKHHARGRRHHGRRHRRHR